MKRKQRKSLPLRRFGYVIRTISSNSNSVNFCFDFLHELPLLWEAISNTRMSVSLGIQTLRSWFGYLMKHSNSCLIYYITNYRQYCFGLLGLISVVLMSGMSVTLQRHACGNISVMPECSNQRTSERAQLLAAMTHPSRVHVLNLHVKQSFVTPKSYI